MTDPAAPPPGPAAERDAPPPFFPPWRHQRPPWWPEGEPWPPRRGPGGRLGRDYRRRFMRRGALFLLLVFVFTVGGCTLAFWLATASFNGLHMPHGLMPLARLAPVAVVLFLVFGAALMLRGLRRVTDPVDDFLDAVSRVADGDLAVRVPERGPHENRRLARAFNTMAERLQANETHRRSLLADVTHELRTPLTVIQGNLEGLLDGVYPADAAHLAPVLDETRVLGRLIDDLRTLAQAESGTLALHREPTDLGVLAGETLAAFRPQAATQGVTLTLAVADDLPLANVDPLRLREVLSNLVANALRYTPGGGTVTLRGRVEAASAGGGEAALVLEVADTGAGIAPERLAHIFDRFYKSPDSPGTGLGLAIAKNLAAAHGGELTAQSAPGMGTTMRLRLAAE
ncbi:MAG: HAMP domain-containing histidine kinase [Anaerolineales bacterium]|nr:HAMP domain-containing histidine kinase [Anaerolineales bacterium]